MERKRENAQRIWASGRTCSSGWRARGQACGHAAEREMRRPAVLGSTQHPASQGTAGLMSSRLPGELGKTEGPGCTRVWLEMSGAEGPPGGMGCTLVTAGLCVCSCSRVHAAKSCLWPRGTDLASCPAPRSAASWASASGPGCLPLPPSSLCLPPALSHHLLPGLLLVSAT